MSARALIFAVMLACSGAAYALDYVSVADNATVLYDAPSLKAKKLFVASRYLPLEQVVTLDNWVKVRDSNGNLAWIEKRATSSKRYVLVTAQEAAVRGNADETAPVVFRAKQQVALEWLGNASAGFIKVRHADGAMGYIKGTEVWGN